MFWMDKLARLAAITAESGVVLARTHGESGSQEERYRYDPEETKFADDSGYVAALELIGEYCAANRRSQLGKEGIFMFPVEPLRGDLAGIGMARNGHTKLASKELVFLVWKFWDIIGEQIREDGAPSGNFIRKINGEVAECGEGELKGLISGSPSLNGKLRVLEKEANAIPEGALKLLSAHPEEKKKGDGIELTTIGLENCNRGCRHCAMRSSPKTQDFEDSELMEWLGIIPLGEEIMISFGEPFIHGGLGGIARRILEIDRGNIVKIGTSGINFSSPQERLAAEGIASLSKREKSQIRLVLSLSGFPNFRIDGMRREGAALKVQRDTVRFAYENGLQIGFVRVMEHHSSFMELFFEKSAVWEKNLRPVVEELAPPKKGNYLVVGEHALGIGCRNARKIGRLAPEGVWRDDECSGRDMGCAIRGGTIPVSLFGDGSIGPGCCGFLSVYPVIANIRETPELSKIEMKVREFSERLQDSFEGAKEQDRDFGCLNCVAVAEKVRHFKRFQKSVGAGNFQRFERLRQERLQGSGRKLARLG